MLRLVEDVVRSEVHGLFIYSENPYAMLGDFNESETIFTTSNGFELNCFQINWEDTKDYELIFDQKGKIEGDNLVITGTVPDEDLIFHNKNYCEISAKISFDITLTIAVNKLTDQYVEFDNVEISNIKIHSGIAKYKDAILSLIIQSGNYKKFFKDYGITTLKDGTPVDSLSKEDLLQQLNDCIDLNLFNKEIDFNDFNIKADLQTYFEDIVSDVVTLENVKQMCSQIDFTKVFYLEIEQDPDASANVAMTENSNKLISRTVLNN